MNSPRDSSGASAAIISTQVCALHICTSHGYYYRVCYLRVAFISLGAPNCAVTIRGWGLIEEILKLKFG